MPFLRRLLAALMASVLAITPLAAQNLPELGEVSSDDLSIATERRIGKQIMREIRQREASYLDDYDIEFYLNQLGGRLACSAEILVTVSSFLHSMIQVSTPLRCRVVISVCIPG
jgi:predicted Zn-dependent protease